MNSFKLETEDGIFLHVHSWGEQEQNPVAIIQIAHGMAEHSARYDDFAQFLVEQGFLVYANDHRGHGETIGLPDEQGFLAATNGFQRLVDDLKLVNDHIHTNHPGIPVILLGHSMGSFVSRRYAQLYGKTIHGLILSGTSYDQGVMGKAGIALAKVEIRRIGMRTPSPLLDQLVFGQYNKHFAPVRTKFDFLTRDDQQVDRYIDDPKCGFICTAGFFHDLFRGLALIHKKREVARTPYALPIFILSGDQDPVGDYGEGVMKVYDLYNRYCENVDIKLYRDGRHEMLNELNRQVVYEDIHEWISSILSFSR